VILWEGGKVFQTFIISPNQVRSVVLGRDFLKKFNVGVFPSGWSVGGPQDPQHRFQKTKTGCFGGFDLPSSAPAGLGVDGLLASPVLKILKRSQVDTSLQDELNKEITSEHPTVGPISKGGDLPHTQAQTQESGTTVISASHPSTNNLESDKGLSDFSVISDPFGVFEAESEDCLVMNDESENQEVVDGLLHAVDLPPEHLEGLRSVVSDFSSIFTKKPGFCGIFEHRIDTGDAKPVFSHPRPMTPEKRTIVCRELDKLIANDLVEPAVSPWASNVLLTPKKNGTFRFCVDYRGVNAVTIGDKYPMPRVDDLLCYLSKSKIYSKFDLSDGFFQIGVAIEDRPKTAFLTPRGLYQFKRAPMGMKNSPASFQRALDMVTSKLRFHCLLGFFDDFLVHSETVEQHLDHLRQFFEIMKNSGFTANPAKAELCQSKIQFLGYVISEGKCKPHADKLEALTNYQVPKDVKGVQRYLGFVGYYRQFIEDFSTKASALTDLLRKKQDFAWTPECQKGFDDLRNALQSQVELCLPDLSKPFTIQCDASNGGIGAVLLQTNEGKREPVWFISRKLTGAEINYSITEKECLAIIYAVKKFKGYIEFTEFTIETDHQALTWLQGIKEPTGRLARWALELQGYQFKIAYRSGALNRTADALSRAYEVLSMDCDSLPSRQDLSMAQAADPDLGQIVQFLRDGQLPMGSREQKIYVLRRGETSMLDSEGCLYKYVGNINCPWEDDGHNWRLWIPDKLKETCVLHFHSSNLGGHLGTSKTYRKLEKRVWWKTMRKDVFRFVQGCKKCQLAKSWKVHPMGIGKSPKVKGPWESLYVDLMGPYTRSSQQNRFLLVVVDNFTKWVEFFPLRNSTADKVVQKLWEVCCKWGFPDSIVADNGVQFGRSDVFKKWCQSFGIKSLFIPPYHPQSNVTERYNQTIKAMIVATIESCKDWDKYLFELGFALRTGHNQTMKFSPAYLNFGRELRTPFDNKLEIVLNDNDEAGEMAQRMNYIWELAKSEQLHSQRDYMTQHNKGKFDADYKVGDLILRKSRVLSNAAKGITASLTNKFEGPFVVVGKKNDAILMISHPNKPETVSDVHVSDTRPFFQVQYESNSGTCWGNPAPDSEEGHSDGPRPSRSDCNPTVKTNEKETSPNREAADAECCSSDHQQTVEGPQAQQDRKNDTSFGLLLSDRADTHGEQRTMEGSREFGCYQDVWQIWESRLSFPVQKSIHGLHHSAGCSSSQTLEFIDRVSTPYPPDVSPTSAGEDPQGLRRCPVSPSPGETSEDSPVLRCPTSANPKHDQESQGIRASPTGKRERRADEVLERSEGKSSSGASSFNLLGSFPPFAAEASPDAEPSRLPANRHPLPARPAEDNPEPNANRAGSAESNPGSEIGQGGGREESSRRPPGWNSPAVECLAFPRTSPAPKSVLLRNNCQS